MMSGVFLNTHMKICHNSRDNLASFCPLYSGVKAKKVSVGWSGETGEIGLPWISQRKRLVLFVFYIKWDLTLSVASHIS